MKKLIALLLSVLLVFALSACGVSEKAQEKTAEKAIENALGGDVNVDIDGDKYTYEDKDGNKMEFGSTEWPAADAAAFIPKFDKGTITACTVMGNIYVIDIENVEQTDYESYFKTVKDGGFINEAITTETEGYHQYQAADAIGNYIVIFYEAEAKRQQIMGTAATKE